MKTIITIYVDRDGSVVVETTRTVELHKIVQALAEATRIVYKNIIEQEARRAAMDRNDLEKFLTFIAKQKNPKLN